MDSVMELNFTDCKTAEEGLQKIKDVMTKEAPLLRRKFLKIDEGSESDKSSICVMQWNVLAQGLTGGDDNFIRCPTEALVKERRRLKLLEQMLTVEPDIMCLQEMDQFEFFQAALKNFGYEGFFMPKRDSACLQMPNNCGPDGCSVMYKVSKFDVVDKEMFYLDSGKPNRGCVLLNLKDRLSGKALCVATTHLKAKDGFSEVRLQEGKKLLEKLEGKVEPIIVCGDFNAHPKEPIVQAFRESSLKLKDAYEAISDLPPYTTWKIRPAKSGGGEVEVCKKIDYIWYSQSKIEVKALLSIPIEEEIGKDRLPCPSFPSDHLDIAAIIHLTEGK